MPPLLFPFHQRSVVKPTMLASLEQPAAMVAVEPKPPTTTIDFTVLDGLAGFLVLGLSLVLVVICGLAGRQLLPGARGPLTFRGFFAYLWNLVSLSTAGEPRSSYVYVAGRQLWYHSRRMRRAELYLFGWLAGSELLMGLRPQPELLAMNLMAVSGTLVGWGLLRRLRDWRTVWTPWTGPSLRFSFRHYWMWQLAVAPPVPPSHRVTLTSLGNVTSPATHALLTLLQGRYCLHSLDRRTGGGEPMELVLVLRGDALDAGQYPLITVDLNFVPAGEPFGLPAEPEPEPPQPKLPPVRQLELSE